VADPAEPTDLGSWLINVGTPESLAGMLPKELRDLDVSAVLNMFSGIDIARGETDSQSMDTPLDRSIHWLPIFRDGN
jgi:hypothetical protein